MSSSAERDVGRWLRTSEAADKLGVSSKTVTRWADERRLSCVTTLGGHRRFDPEVIGAAYRKMQRLGSPKQE